MSEWHGDGTRLVRAHKLRRGDRISVDGNWLEVIRINPTAHTQPLLEVLYVNGKSVLYRPDEEVMILDR